MTVGGVGDERALLGATLAFLRDAVLRKVEGLTDEVVRSLPSLDVRGRGEWGGARDLRWILVHLIQETARHAGHADATRELLGGLKGD